MGNTIHFFFLAFCSPSVVSVISNNFVFTKKITVVVYFLFLFFCHVLTLRYRITYTFTVCIISLYKKHFFIFDFYNKSKTTEMCSFFISRLNVNSIYSKEWKTNRTNRFVSVCIIKMGSRFWIKKKTTKICKLAKPCQC